MTQGSWPFACGCGDGIAITHQDWQLFNDLIKFRDRTDQGVIYTTHPTYSGLLTATNPAGNTVRISNGAGLVLGALYTNTANVDFDVTGPGGGAQTDLIVLRYTIASCTVRLAHIQGTPGGAAAALTQGAAVWEVPICQIYKAAGTNITTLTDLREFVNARLKVEFFPALSSFDPAIPLTVYPPQMLGASLNQSSLGFSWAVAGRGIMPLDFLPVGTYFSLRAVIINPNASAAINVDVHRARYGQCSELYNIHETLATPATESLTQNVRECVSPIRLPMGTVTPGDMIEFYLERGDTGGGDTAGDVYVAGWRMVYLGSTE